MADLSEKFWRGKRVFLTGHTGFKGSWMGALLTQLGARVTGFSLAPATEPNHFALLKSDYESLEGDIRNLVKLKQAMHERQPDVVIHMAAQALVRPSYADPVGTYATNVMGTMHILESIRNLSSVRAALMVTSDKCYENRETMTPYRESDPMGGYDPYSSSKGCAEILTSSMRRSFFAEGNCQVASVRAGNVIGGGDWAADRLLPDCMRAWAEKKPARVRNLAAVRPWQHVLDPLSGYLLLGQRLFEGKKQFAKGWNLGPALSSAWPVEKVLGFCRENLKGFEYTVEPKPEHEAKLLTLDCEQAQRELDWRPRWPIERALSETLSWYSTYYDSGKLLTERQIEAYKN